MAKPEPDDHLAPLDDLHLALTVGGSLQTSIEHADTKAAVLLSAPAGAAALVANSLQAGTLVPSGGLPVSAATVLLATLFVTGLAGSLWNLGRCLWPRLAGPAGANRFALPRLAAARRMPSRHTPVVDQREEAWRLAAVLADIAMRKHRAIGASLVWIGTTALAALGWLCLAGVVGGSGT